MTFARRKPLGWAFGEMLSSADLTAIDLNLSRAIDGAAGGPYAPTTTIEIGGDGMRFVGPVIISGPAAYVQYRQAIASSVPTITLDIGTDICQADPDPGVPLVVTLKDSPAPPGPVFLTVSRSVNNVNATVVVKRQTGATTILTMPANAYCWADFYYVPTGLAANWYVARWAGNAVL